MRIELTVTDEEPIYAVVKMREKIKELVKANENGKEQGEEVNLEHWQDQ